MVDGDGQSRGDDDPDVAAFERVDWDDHGGPRRHVSAERVSLVVGVLAVVALYLYHRSTGDVYLVARYAVGGADWLFMLGVVVGVTYGVVPLVRRPERGRRIARRLRERPATAVSLVFVGGLAVVGLWALLTGFRPELTYGVGSDYLDKYQPPVGFTVPEEYGTECLGRVTGGEFDREQTCHGTWQFPLGTDHVGYKMSDLLAAGTRTVAYAVVVTAGVIVPLATLVGVVAGYYGGRVDDLLMGYVDVQLSVPAVVVYLVAFNFVFNSMFVFLAAFGLLSWGGVARIVRSETLQRREEGYVLSARAVGTSGPAVIRRHVLPNVTNSVVPAVFQLIAVVVLTEAALSFLGFNPLEWTWGNAIGDGLQYRPPLVVWWTSVFPTVALTVTVLACKVAGDGLRDVLDPRGER